MYNTPGVYPDIGLNPDISLAYSNLEYNFVLLDNFVPLQTSTMVVLTCYTNQVAAYFFLPSLLLAPIITITIFELLLIASVLPLITSTTPVDKICVPPFIIDIPDPQEPTLKLNPTTTKPKPEWTKIKNPQTNNG